MMRFAWRKRVSAGGAPGGEHVTETGQAAKRPRRRSQRILVFHHTVNVVRSCPTVETNAVEGARTAPTVPAEAA